MFKVFEHGKQLSEGLERSAIAFQSTAQKLGYSPFEAHDVVRVFRAFATVAERENVPLVSLERQASGFNLPKLALIAPLVQRAPGNWAYWLDMAESLPLQDLVGPVRQALREAA